MTDLLPCPFCGGRSYLTQYGERYYIECGQCGAEPGYSGENEPGWPSFDDAAKHWNTRYNEYATDGLLASMALRYRHDFGILPADEQRTIMAIMRQIHEEVVGRGFYKPEHEEKYLRALNYDG